MNIKHAPREDDRARGLGPPHQAGDPPGGPGQRQAPAHDFPRPTPSEMEEVAKQDPDPPPAREVREHPRGRFCIRRNRSCTIPGQLLRPAQLDRDGVPPRAGQRSRRSMNSGCPEVIRKLALRPTRPDSRHRHGGEREVDDAGRDDPGDQPESMNSSIITIEDPIEFLHRDDKSIINQREVGSDTASFHEALRHILRQDPNVHHDRRDPRRGDDGNRPQGGGHRPPGAQHAAHDRRAADDQPHHLVLPAAPPPGDPLSARLDPAGG